MKSGGANDLRERIAEVLAAMPPGQQWRDGMRVDWGPPGNRDRAVHLAARLGHVFNPRCRSCDSDLWMVLKIATK